MNNIKRVFTTGTFDILHYGHINLLKNAKSQGDYLIVGLNTTKNGKETYYSYEERKKMLEAIKYVDCVVPIHNQNDKYYYLDNVDIFAIGSDYIGYYDMDEIEKELVRDDKLGKLFSSEFKYEPPEMPVFV